MFRSKGMRACLFVIGATLCCAACGVDELPIELPFIDIGYTYECTVTIECDGQTLEEESEQCGAPASLEEVSTALWYECRDQRVIELGCSSWSCATKCSGVGYCTL